MILDVGHLRSHSDFQAFRKNIWDAWKAGYKKTPAITQPEFPGEREWTLLLSSMAKLPRKCQGASIPPKLEPTKKAPSVLIAICKKKGYFLFFFLALKNGLKGAVIYTRFLLIAQNCAAFVLEAKKWFYSVFPWHPGTRLNDTLKQGLVWFYYCSVYMCISTHTPEQIKVKLPKAFWVSRS